MSVDDDEVDDALVIRLVNVDDNEVDGVGDEVGGVSTSVQ